MANVIAYTRVSTAKQGIGLDAQMTMIRSWAAAHGADIISEYSEKESGKDTIHRAELQAAIAEAKRTGATLVVAKLDRLSRDVANIFELKKDTKLHFEVCDMDASDTMMLGIFATLAQKERELISERTKAAIAAKKAKKMELLRQAAQTNDAALSAALKAEAEAIKDSGNPNAAEHMRRINHMGAAARKAAADSSAANRHAYNAIRLMDGTLQTKADFLNAEGYTTPKGHAYTRQQVKRLIERFA